jgi:translation initiation factor 2 subunit 3
MHILRSFDVNKPGTPVEEIVGGVIGGTIQRGKFRIGDELEIKPGIRKESYGKVQYEPLLTTIASLFVGEEHVEEATCGGLVGVGTYFDPALTKADGLVGNVAGKVGDMPPVIYELLMDTHLFDKAIGTEDQVKID